MQTPKTLKYTKTHEWLRIVEPGIAEVGITDFAQHQLSDITYVELPAIDRHVTAGEDAVVVESIKAASDVYAPVAGSITEVNEAIDSAPEVINADPYGRGWLFRISLDSAGDVTSLLTADQYEQLMKNEH